MKNNLLVSLIGSLVLFGCGGAEEVAETVIAPIAQVTVPTSTTLHVLEVECNEHFMYGLPVSSIKGYTPVCHQGFVSAFDNEAKIPRYVAHELTVNEAITYVERDPSYIFEVDPSIESQYQAQYSDYTGSGYDRSHLQPWGDSAILSEALDSNYFTNIAPMLASYNRGIWLELENAIRQYSRDYGKDLYVITGAVDGVNQIGNGVEVPKSFYKIILDNDNEKVTAYLIEQEGDLTKELVAYAVTIDAIEELTGLNFFPLLSEQVQESLESDVLWVF